jgi:hypothetical protein
MHCDAERVNRLSGISILAALIEMCMICWRSAMHYLLRPCGPNTHNGPYARSGRTRINQQRLQSSLQQWTLSESIGRMCEDALWLRKDQLAMCPTLNSRK